MAEADDGQGMVGKVARDIAMKVSELRGVAFDMQNYAPGSNYWAVAEALARKYEISERKTAAERAETPKPKAKKTEAEE